GDSAVDDTARIGGRYRYFARLVAAAAGAGLRESPPTRPEVEVDYADRFPPAAPSLVTADPVAPARDTEARWEIRLAWSSPIDADVAGYRIYRAEGDGAFALAASLPASETTWTDAAVEPGRRYRYSVTAFDTADPPNESERSDTAGAEIPGDRPAEGRP